MKFSIRDLLWLTLVAGALLAGVISYVRVRTENHRLRTIIDSQEETIGNLIKSIQILQKSR
jgi:hypothetical protein